MIAMGGPVQSNLSQVPCYPTIEENLPVYEAVGFENVDLFRISTCEIWNVGDGSVNGVVMKESDALVLARVAMGEQPNSLNERVYIMWLIRLRAELGYKEAGHRGDYYQPQLSFGGRSTSIKQEALCIGGCQFEAVRLWNNIYFPADLEQGQLSAMIYPIGEQVIDFYHTYKWAKKIVNAPMSDFPEELKGFDGFRSSSIDWIGTHYWEGGKPSTIFFRDSFYVNVFRDEYPWDNNYWESEAARPALPPYPQYYVRITT